MNVTAINLLRMVFSGVSDIRSLADRLGIGQGRLGELIRQLSRDGYIKRSKDVILPQDTPHAILLWKVSKIYSIEVLLRNSNGVIFPILTEPCTINQIISHTGLSPSTIHRSISDLRSIGVIRTESKGTRLHHAEEIWLNGNTDLMTLANILKIRQESDLRTEIIFRDSKRTLMRTPYGQKADGQTTGFTLFSEYGIQCRSPYDYYIKQNEPLDIHDVLIHAVVSAYNGDDVQDMTIAVIFYLRHKDRVDPVILRRKAAEFDSSAVWLDIEAYIRGHKIINANLFLPWDEFITKAKMYDIPDRKYLLPRPSDTLFEDIGDNIPEKITAYLIGGENMRIKGLKQSTMDCDIVVESVHDFNLLKRSLDSLGYSKISDAEISSEDQRLDPDEIFVHKDRVRVDVFTRRIMRHAILSENMIKNAEYTTYKNLRMGLLKNEHVFLLKAIAGREGDIHDMGVLVRGRIDQIVRSQYKFDWNMVWDEIMHQEDINHMRDFTADIFEQISLLGERTDIKAPFFNKLRLHAIDRIIHAMLRGGKRSQKIIVNLLKGAYISEKMIRNRIDALARQGVVKKNKDGQNILISLQSNPEFFYKDWKIDCKTLAEYLNWRFPLSERPSDLVGEFVDKLRKLGYGTIGDVDKDIIKTLNGRHADSVGICQRMAGVNGQTT